MISRARIAERLAAGLKLNRGAKRYMACLRRGDADECSYCGCPLTDENRTIDHKLSVLRGGSNLNANLCLACQRCNRVKGMQTPEEFRDSVEFRDIMVEVAARAVPKKPKKKPVVPLRKELEHSLGVRTAKRGRRSVPIGSLMSAESQRALLLLVEKDPCDGCERLQRVDPTALCPEHGVEF